MTEAGDHLANSCTACELRPGTASGSFGIPIISAAGFVDFWLYCNPYQTFPTGLQPPRSRFALALSIPILGWRGGCPWSGCSPVVLPTCCGHPSAWPGSGGGAFRSIPLCRIGWVCVPRGVSKVPLYFEVAGSNFDLGFVQLHGFKGVL